MNGYFFAWPLKENTFFIYVHPNRLLTNTFTITENVGGKKLNKRKIGENLD